MDEYFHPYKNAADDEKLPTLISYYLDLLASAPVAILSWVILKKVKLSHSTHDFFERHGNVVE